jgi:hypothetical protein
MTGHPRPNLTATPDHLVVDIGTAQHVAAAPGLDLTERAWRSWRPREANP